MTYQECAELLRYEPETGELFWKKRLRNCTASGARAGSLHKHSGRWMVKINRKQFYCSRIAWLLHYGKWPDAEADHKNRDQSDDRIENLRDVPHAINCRNKSNNIWESSAFLEASRLPAKGS